MKPLILLPAISSATLFLGVALHGGQEMLTEPAPAGSASETAASPAVHLDARAAELLRRFDKNHDGKLDDEEKAAAHEAMQAELENDAARSRAGAPVADGTSFRELPRGIPVRVAQAFDKNHDGKLDAEELAAARKYLAQTGITAALQAEALRRFDADGDGRLDADERRALENFNRDHPGELRRAVMLRLFDRNHDGKLDADERAAAKAALEASLPAEEKPVVSPMAAAAATPSQPAAR